DPDWDLGKRGFKRPQDIRRIYHINTLNIKDLDSKIDDLTLKNVATKSGNTYTLNLKDINIQKILGRGEINKKINLTVDRASKRAIEKIESAGGKVTLLSEAN
ncbi:MAG: uL15m family ribosomal protein, partial [Candidatus Hermodarchaeota archaeon]